MKRPEITTRCRWCGEYAPALITPTKRKRVVQLTCARCGNPIRVQYIPKERKENSDADHDIRAR